MRANSHHRPLLVAAIALQIGVATAATVGLLRGTNRPCVSTSFTSWL
ncbi:hypothetical protein Tco_1528653, partial [Tanacetum coccineum]